MLEARRASSKKRVLASGSAAALSVRILSATRRPRTLSLARYTRDMPPPRNSSTSYFPTRDGCSINVSLALVPVLLLPRFLHGGSAVSAGEHAFYVFELDRGVPDLKARAQDVIDPLQNRIAFRRRHVVDQHVAAQGAGVRAEAPDVQVMDVNHALDAAQFGGDVLQFQPFGQSF